MSHLIIRHLGRRDYVPVWEEMKTFVADRPKDAHGEIWVVEHNPVFTLGSNAKPEHLLAPDDIPVVPVDRGGQVTYHGPGQLVVYPLVYLTRTGLGVRDLVTALELSVVDLLADSNIEAYPRKDAPGVYVDQKKIASIGLRIKRNWSYHGLSLNVNMDLEPFQRINPCGFAGLEITQCSALGGPTSLESATKQYIPHLLKHLRYDTKLVTSLPETA
ncbi:MAG: lipoyl(octanoyl) transferase LipB [Gammaproteobacteria bacterium]